jgi:YebC/PmpR family DNA-binding regulatory protein
MTVPTCGSSWRGESSPEGLCDESRVGVAQAFRPACGKICGPVCCFYWSFDMSGHSKWASIKHKKGALDAKRGKIFTRLIKELTVAARAGGGDPDMNPRLRSVIADAKAANMPADNIKRAIRKGTGEEPGVSYEEAQYEAYGPGGAAVIIDVLTDNKNRTVGELRHLLEKHNGNLASTNAVAWMFAKKGYIVIEKAKADEEKLLAAVLDAGADDLQDDDDNWEVLSSPEAFSAVRDAVKQLGLEPASAQVSMIPQNYVKLEGKVAQQMLKLMEALDDQDDVQHVWSNFDISEQEIEASLA